MMKTSHAVVFLAMIAMASLVNNVLADDNPDSVELWYRKLHHARKKLTKFHFYFHDIVSGTNPTAVEIAAAASTRSSPTFFGLTRVFDDPLTVGGDPTSEAIGYGQGIYVLDSKESVSLLFDLTFYFTNKKFNGSTLVVQGRNPLGQQYRELAITGGSGAFRLAKGTAVATTYWANATTQDGIVEFTAFVLHYETPSSFVDEQYVGKLRSAE